MKCPCHSGLNYDQCCGPYHEGTPAPTALALMRSRYAAYALNKSDYIIATTHPDNPRYQKDFEKWRKEIASFSQNTQFQDLKILEFIDGDNQAFVTFHAVLKPARLIEKSSFVKINGRWLYRDGELFNSD